MLWIGFFVAGWRVPGYTVGGSGLMPVAVIVLAATVAMIVVSPLTRPPTQATLQLFFPDPDGDAIPVLKAQESS